MVISAIHHSYTTLIPIHLAQMDGSLGWPLRQIRSKNLEPGVRDSSYCATRVLWQKMK